MPPFAPALCNAIFAAAGKRIRRLPIGQQLATAYKPYIETCIAAFGVSRAIFESNFPSDGASSNYQILWNALKRLADGYSPSHKAALFSRTATRVYRLA